MTEIASVLGVMVPLSAVVLGISLGAWSLFLEHQRKRLQYHEREKMIEKGLTPPPILPEESKARTPEDSLRRGVVLVFLGVGLAVGAVLTGRVLSAQVGGLMAAGGAIVGFLGLGNLAYYFLSRRKPDASVPTEL